MYLKLLKAPRRFVNLGHQPGRGRPRIKAGH